MWNRPFSRLLIIGGCSGLVGAGLCGCGRDARLADHRLRDPKVRDVEHYGLRLDKDATPQQVVFVLLRALRDDCQAATASDRESALDVQFDVAAASELRASSTSGRAPAEFLYRMVYHWAPTVCYYAAQLPTEWAAAKDRFVLVGPLPSRNSRAATEESFVLMQFDDPAGDPNGDVVLSVNLVRDGGFWRVRRVGYEPSHRKLKLSSASASG